MTIDHRVAARLKGRSPAWRLGAATTAAIGIVLTAWSLSTDFVEASNNGFFGDAATYYMLGHSLADDFDFEYQREDLVRVWQEYPGGPEGVFLKRGKDSHLFFAKSFIYPLLASPFIWLFGTNGFMVFHALLMTLSFACAYAFLVARSHPVAALIFALAFVFVSVAPVYMVQIAPDFFNFAIVLFAFFFWCYKEVAGPAPDGERGIVAHPLAARARSDVVAAALLGVAMFSKPTQIMLIAPLLVSAVLRRQWWRGLKIGGVFAAVAVGLFVINTAVTGEWNYQGGDRKTFYGAGGVSFRGGFPLQSDQNTFETVGLGREGGGLLTDVLLTHDALLEVFPHNLGYFMFGRHTGFAIYFFPGVVAVLLFLAATRDRAMWQWLTFAAGCRIRDRAVAVHAVHVFRAAAVRWATATSLAATACSCSSCRRCKRRSPDLSRWRLAPCSSRRSCRIPFSLRRIRTSTARRGLYRWLPTELTMVNDLPVNTGPSSRIRQPLGGTPPVFAYFIDDNIYNREGDAFWVRGESSADILLRAPIAPEADAAGFPPGVSLHIDKLTAIPRDRPEAESRR
jgi:hypothetical protein